jgi:predicted unusual protein kinase regulating ubiquinone biosynthesis (AarF/ABC1/UbiB family)
MSRDDDQKPLAGIAKGFRDRTMVTAKLAGRIGLKFAKRTLVGRGRDATAEEKAAADDDAVEVATDLVEQLGSLKGLVMKLGQIASYMPGAMPPRAQKVLTQLQANTTPMEWAQVQALLRSELGAPPHFDHIATEPFAAASIGQVHRARVGDREVAVKIQYPGIEGVLQQDLKAAKVLVKLGMLGTAMDAASLTEELRSRVLEECDYQLEARNQTAFRHLLADVDGARVPEVIDSHTTGRVLTSEFVDGQGFYEFCETASQADRDRAGAVIFRVCMDSIFRHCCFNGDPHPGNYLLHEGGGVTFLDYGCVRRFQPSMIEAWKEVAAATLDDDYARWKEAYPALGFVKRVDKFDWPHQWKMMQYLYEPFTATEPYAYTHEYVQRSYGMMIFDNPNRNKTAMPPEWLLLNRLQWGVNSILAHLGSRVVWGDVLRACASAPTVPATL